MKKFKGRPVISGEHVGKALVTQSGFNILATFLTSLMENDGSCVCNDINNPEMYGKSLNGEILCIPQAIGSTSSGFMMQSIAAANIGPKAMLFARKAEPLALAGILIADIWEGAQIITIDELGDDFLSTVKNGDQIHITPDGTVVVYPA